MLLIFSLFMVKYQTKFNSWVTCLLTEDFKFINEDLTNLNSSTNVINMIKSVQSLCGVHSKHWRGEMSVFFVTRKTGTKGTTRDVKS